MYVLYVKNQLVIAIEDFPNNEMDRCIIKMEVVISEKTWI